MQHLPLYLIACMLHMQPDVASIQLPAGYTRIAQPAGSFGNWLRSVPLKGDKTVYLYNGRQKLNQSAQFAVLDMTVGTKDLQQCADAVMRLYAEYLYNSKQFSRIAFHATDGTLMDYRSWMRGDRFIIRQGKLKKQRTAAACNTRTCFESYLETVFSYAGTLSLSKELQAVPSVTDIRPGDVFIKGGTPGHAVVVMDVAVNRAGEKMFLLAQSYMPAQDIHILKNPADAHSPWYSTRQANVLVTPEWTFESGSLKRFH